MAAAALAQLAAFLTTKVPVILELAAVLPFTAALAPVVLELAAALALSVLTVKAVPLRTEALLNTRVVADNNQSSSQTIGRC